MLRMEPGHRSAPAAPEVVIFILISLLFASCSADSISSATPASVAPETAPAATATALPTASPDRSLTPTIAGPLPNDNPPGIAITTLPFSYSGDVTQAQIHAMEMASSCGSGSQSVWFSYTGEQAMKLAADTFGSGYDTILDVYQGSLTSDLQNPGFETLVPLACNDNAGDSSESEVVFAATPGTSYVIRITTHLDSRGGILTFHLAQG
jgi:hypothetical protein